MFSNHRLWMAFLAQLVAWDRRGELSRPRVPNTGQINQARVEHVRLGVYTAKKQVLVHVLETPGPDERRQSSSD